MFCAAPGSCDRPDASWFDSGLPVVGYFHDRDVSLHGVEWMTRALDEWSAAGVRRFVTLRDIALASQATLAIAGGEGPHALVVRSGETMAAAAASAVRLPVRYHLGDAGAVHGVIVGCAPGVHSFALDDPRASGARSCAMNSPRLLAAEGPIR